MTWKDESSPDELQAALEARRFDEAKQIVRALLSDLEAQPRPVGTRMATKILTTLRGHTWFDSLYEVADRFAKYGQADPEVRRQLGQARIEQGFATEALVVLKELQQSIENRLQEPGLSPMNRDRFEYELGEALGLMGRAYKQLYVDARPTASEARTHDRERALECYGRAFNEKLGDYLWHGVNLIALRTHGKRIKEGNWYLISNEARNWAEEILEAIALRENKGPLQPWDLANRIECHLAAGRPKDATEAVRSYLDSPGLNAFNIHSTRRQLIELWNLRKDAPPGDQILPMMSARFAQLGGSDEPIDLDPRQMGQFEKVWGATGYQPIQWLATGLQRARAVARLGPDKYEGWGTGFLFDGEWISPEYAGRHLALTNAHVCTDDPEVQNRFPYPKPPEETRLAFLGLDGDVSAVELRIEKVIWTSPPGDVAVGELDATLLEIGPPPKGVEPPPLAKAMPPEKGEGARVNILGHPRGLNLRVSMQDNQMVTVAEKVLHYRTPTDPGSSGSPVFDQEWNLVALHHASAGAKKANEGIRMDALLAAMRPELS